MNALLIIGTMIVGAGVGAIIGVRQVDGADDLGIGVTMYGGAGVVAGGFVGVVVGSVLFA